MLLYFVIFTAKRDKTFAPKPIPKQMTDLSLFDYFKYYWLLFKVFKFKVILT